MTPPILNNRKTTNRALLNYYGTDSVEQILASGYKIEDRLMVVCQKQKINEYYAASFEEAFVLANYDNEIVKNMLKQIVPKTFQESMDDGGLEKPSYRIQRALADKKVILLTGCFSELSWTEQVPYYQSCHSILRMVSPF